MGIRKLYAEYEENAYKRIISLIETVPAENSAAKPGEVKLKREVFKSFLDKIYKRQK